MDYMNIINSIYPQPFLSFYKNANRQSRAITWTRLCRCGHSRSYVAAVQGVVHVQIDKAGVTVASQRRGGFPVP
jgi:hypothetical protein